MFLTFQEMERPCSKLKNFLYFRKKLARSENQKSTFQI